MPNKVFQVKLPISDKVSQIAYIYAPHVVALESTSHGASMTMIHLINGSKILADEKINEIRVFWEDAVTDYASA